MYKELAILDKRLSAQEATKQLFKAIHHKLSGVVTYSHNLQHFREIMPEGFTLSCPINYPDGVDDSLIIQNSILNASRKGANSVDVVVPSNLIANIKYDYIAAQMRVYQNICKDEGITLRAMVDYCAFSEADIVDVMLILADVGVEYMITNTNNINDDVFNQLIFANQFKQYPEINIIINSAVWTPRQYNAVLDSKPFGVRINNHNVLQNLGV